jgi:hypothetical protein
VGDLFLNEVDHLNNLNTFISFITDVLQQKGRKGIGGRWSINMRNICQNMFGYGEILGI